VKRAGAPGQAWAADASGKSVEAGRDTETFGFRARVFLCRFLGAATAGAFAVFLAADLLSAFLNFSVSLLR
jgi:hypothetical protein